MVAPHMRHVAAAGGLLCPYGQSAAMIKESVEGPWGGGVRGELDRSRVGGVSPSAATGGGIAA